MHENESVLPLRGAVVGSQPNSQGLDEVFGRQPFIGKCTSNELRYNEVAKEFRARFVIKIVWHVTHRYLLLLRRALQASMVQIIGH
jgi:hypothetical protein